MLIFLYLFLNTAIFWVRIQSAGPQWGQFAQFLYKY